jgi:hypothetical protein
LRWAEIVVGAVVLPGGVPKHLCQLEICQAGKQTKLRPL